jgi:hypothetical protein
MQNLCQGRHGYIFRYTTEELRSITTPYATINEAAELHLTQGSREATSSIYKETPSIVAIHSANDGTKGGKKRQKQCPQGPRPR